MFSFAEDFFAKSEQISAWFCACPAQKRSFLCGVLFCVVLRLYLSLNTAFTVFSLDFIIWIFVSSLLSLYAARRPPYWNNAF